MQKLDFWATSVLIINCHFGSYSRVQHDKTATAKTPGADIRAAAPKARKLPEDPVGLDPLWEQRKAERLLDH